MSLIANALARLADIFDFNPISNRNLFVDGAKETWSIGVGSNQALPAGGYGPCVLQILAAGTGGAGTYAHSATSPAQVSRLGWPRGPNQFGVFTQTVASTGNLAARTGPLMAMRIEDVNHLEGSSVTFSVTLCNSGGASVTIPQVAIVQNFGTGGSPSGNVATIVPVNWVVPADGNWRRYSVRLDIPNTIGKTMGTTNTVGFTQISVEFPVGQTFTINDCFWQAEFCSPQAPAAGWPTAFEYRGQAAEAQRVERYYEISNHFYGVGAFNSATIAYVLGRQRTPKRGAPTVTPSGTFTLYGLAIGNQAIAAANISGAATIDGVLYTITCSAATAGQPCLLEDNSSSKVIFDARL